jgi:hypothetical protein
MIKIKRYTQEEAMQILKINVDMRTEYNECKEDYRNCELDCSIFSANIRNLTEDPTKVVVQFITYEPTEYTEYIDEEDEDGTAYYNNLIADSLEEAVVIACLEV